ncbi:MAG: cyanophycin synthetase [Nitriliruptoraceae bacterium]
MTSEDFTEAVDALLARGPGRMVPDLARITALADLLGDPQQAYPSIHVTGTNGKGSTVKMIGSLCAAAGVSAGTYTSPHLQTIRERLSLAGRAIGPTRFAQLYHEVAAFADLVDDQVRRRDGQAADTVTFFEMLTAMAYWWFADIPVDVGVFEVGMGGKWDATNLVRGDVAVINAIDLDHRELGSTPQAVATEKAGIIKPGSVVVLADQVESVDEVISAAAVAADATVWRYGVEFEVIDRQVAVGGQLVTLRIGDRIIDEILLPLHGMHQARNAALAVAAFAAFTDAAFAAMDDDVVRHGLEAVMVPGRLEIVRRGPTVILDGAHNPHGARAVAATLAESFGFSEVMLVVACFEDKDVEAILAELVGAVSHVVVTRAPSDRAASLDRMYRAALAAWAGTAVAVERADDVAAALELAESMVGPGDGILVAGSLVTVGAARDHYMPIDDVDDDVVLEPDDAQAATEEAFEALVAGLDLADDADDATDR